MKSSIVFNRVSKRYRRYAQTSLRDRLSALGQRLLSRPAVDPEADMLWAVRDLTFEVMPGRTVGIIGANGAGKTTTLKLLSAITQPTNGSIAVSGRIATLIELGAGFHPDLTGRENVYLNGAILGMRRREVRERFDAIVDFAELARFIDTPVKYYSSGMYARLGFAVAAFTNPDVLVVDEVLAVGDYAFQQKCYARMHTLQQQGCTILLVSHNLAAIADICQEVIVLDLGRVIFHGPTPEAMAEYANAIRRSAVSKSQIAVGQDGIGQRLMTHAARVVGVYLADRFGQPVKVVAPGDWIRVHATIRFEEDATHPQFSCFVRDEQGRVIYDQTTSWSGTATPGYRKGEEATVTFSLQMNVIDGIYVLGIDLHYADLTCYYDRVESAAAIVVSGGNGAKGIANLNCRFDFSGAAEPVASTLMESDGTNGTTHSKRRDPSLQR